MEWNKDLEKKILKKSKFTLTFRIIRIIFIIIFLYALYMMGINFAADRLNVGNEAKYFSSLAIEWTIPNVRGELGNPIPVVNAFGTSELSFNLLKKVGNGSTVIGEATVTKKISNRQSHITYAHPGRQRLTEFSFSLPEDPRTNKKLDADTFPDVWETLDMLPNGTVGELAFSTTSFMEAEELIQALKDYDIHIVWMPLYTGQFRDYEPDMWGSSENTLSVYDVIGLTGGVDFSEDNNNFYQTLQINQLDEESIAESKKLMLKNMEELLKNPAVYYESFLGLSHLKEKFRYLTNDGFTVYGAVVTGPVKELLKLKDLPIIQGEQLGDVELWNWSSDQ